MEYAYRTAIVNDCALGICRYVKQLAGGAYRIRGEMAHCTAVHDGLYIPVGVYASGKLLLQVLRNMENTLSIFDRRKRFTHL